MLEGRTGPGRLIVRGGPVGVLARHSGCNARACILHAVAGVHLRYLLEGMGECRAVRGRRLCPNQLEQSYATRNYGSMSRGVLDITSGAGNSTSNAMRTAEASCCVWLLGSRLAGDTLAHWDYRDDLHQQIPVNSYGDSEVQRTIAANLRVYALYMHVQAHAHGSLQSCRSSTSTTSSARMASSWGPGSGQSSPIARAVSLRSSPCSPGSAGAALARHCMRPSPGGPASEGRASWRATEINWALANGYTELHTSNEERNAPINRLNARLGYRPGTGRIHLVGPIIGGLSR